MTFPPGASLLQISYADRLVATSHVFADFASLGVPDERIVMPYSMWAVDTADGPLLVDTGFHVPDAYWVGDAQWRPVGDAVRAAGIEPQEVTRVVLTHLHFDHAGGLGLFRNARVFVARRELEHWEGRSAEELRRGFVDPAHLETLRRAGAEGRLELVEGRAEVAPGVTMIPAPGHTPGQCAVLVETPAGRRILASDAAHFFEQLELGWRFFAHDDAAAMDASIAMLKRLAAEAGAPIVPGHDVRVRERYPALAGPAATFTTVIA